MESLTAPAQTLRGGASRRGDRTLPAQFSRQTDRHLRTRPPSSTRELRRAVRGEVRFDRGSRALYATDASNYRQVPIGLVVPRDEDDVRAAVAVCRAFERADPAARRRHEPRRPVLQRRGRPRLHEVHEPHSRARSREAHSRASSPASSSIRFAHAPKRHQLTFGPDPSTHSRCTLGGMIGNNSCGTHSLLAGKTVDNVARARRSCSTTAPS